MPYLSPTIGLVIPPEDYNRFCGNLRYYATQPIRPLRVESAHNIELFRKLESSHGKLVFGQCGDVEICFLHYKSFDDAKQKWERRFSRVNYDCVIYKNNDNNGLKMQDLVQWNAVIEDKRSIFITLDQELYRKSNSMVKILSSIQIKNIRWVDDTTGFSKKYDIKKILNNIFENKKVNICD